MSEQRGKLLTCDRCGKTVFLKELEAKERDADGGYTRWNEYKHEKPPEGWSYKYLGEYKDHYNLCPECSKKLEEVLGEFFSIKEEKR
jgi:DNA-directed RNA polymerase subunit RPC12/RpoP